jgi:gliding motility-associated-like protein
MMKKVFNIIIVLGLSFFSSAQVGTYVVTTIAGNGQIGYSGDGDSALIASFNRPYGIVVDDNGNLYIADQLNHCIRKVDNNNIVNTIINTTDITNFSPSNIEYSNGALYFVQNNTTNTILYKYDLATNNLINLYSTALPSSDSYTNLAIKGDIAYLVRESQGAYSIDMLYNITLSPQIWVNYSSGTSSFFIHDYSTITDLEINDNGNLLVLNSFLTGGGELIELDLELLTMGWLMTKTSGFFEGMVHSQGRTYIADKINYTIFYVENNIDYPFAGVTGAQGYVDGSASTAKFDTPVKLAADSYGNIYITETFLHVIRVIGFDCDPAEIPVIKLGDYTDECPNELYLYVSSGNLNDNQNWQWSFDSCGSQNNIGNGDTLYFNPFTNNTFYVRGEGGCASSPNCGEFNFQALTCDTTQITINTFTAFSPNNDGVNDQWIIEGIDSLLQNKVFIYNRWGDLIKRIDNYNNVDKVWDGSSDIGARVSSGTYFYIIEKNNLKISSGWVEVVR